MLALILVQCLVDNSTVFDVDLRLSWVGLPSESVLHPVLIVTLKRHSVNVMGDRLNDSSAPQGSPHGRGRREIPCVQRPL